MTLMLKLRTLLIIAAFVFVSVAFAVAQESKPTSNLPLADQTVAEIRALEQKVETATLGADASFLENVYASDFRFTHGNSRLLGTRSVSNKTETLQALQPGRFISRDLDSVDVEPHGDVALTTGRILVRTTSKDPELREYTIYYVRVYQRRDGRWQLLSHRTVREVSGPL